MITTWIRDIFEYKKRNNSLRWVILEAILSVIFAYIVFLHYSNLIFDKFIGHWLSSRMSQSSINIFGIISDLGDLKLIVPSTFGLLLYLLWKQKWSYAAGLFFCVFGGGAISSLLKFLFQQPKININHSYIFDGDFGFPSGHTIMGLLFYGYLAYILVNSSQNKKWHWVFMSCAGLIFFLIGLSRLLIGVHLPTDVFGGWAIGLIWLIISIVLSQRIGTKSYR
jgi:membrane-associated phospholipid phosphatase